MDDSAELSLLEGVVSKACSEQTEWPARVAAGICAGVDFAVAHPEIVGVLTSELDGEAERLARYERIIGRFTGLLQMQAPVGDRLPGSTDPALVGGIVGLVGDHLRMGRADRLVELRPDLVLFALLPYLGFSEAKSWAN